MANKTFYVRDEELWRAFQDQCAAQDRSASRVLEDLMIQWMQKRTTADDKLARIREILAENQND